MKEKPSGTDFSRLSAAVFMWDIWYACNYRCSYCPWEMSKSWEAMAKKHRVISPAEWIACWERMHRKYDSSHVYFIGGEPLLYPRIDEILEALSRKHYLSVITNLSMPIDAARRLVQKLPPERVRFGASFHPEFSDLDQFLEKLAVFQEADFQVWASMVAWPPFIGEIKKYMDVFESRGIGLDLQTFFGTYQGKSYPLDYTREEKLAISPYIADILKPHGLGQEPTLGKPCGSGHIYSKILGNGDVYRCGSVVDYDSPAPMGNILDPDFELWAGPTPCPRRTCDCGESRYLWENYVKEHPAATSSRACSP